MARKNKIMSNPFGDLVKERRHTALMTLDQVAARLKTHKGYVSGFETGAVNPPRPYMIKKLAKLFNIPEIELQVLAHACKAPVAFRNAMLRKIGY